MNLPITFFTNFAAATKTEQLVALDELVERIRTTTGPAKVNLPWLKCARFGDRRTEKNSLRWDGNLLAITGVELDYDAEQISFDEAVAILRTAAILCIVYTSPSHTEDTPRWRVLGLLSREYPPEERDRFLARLNGLLGGVAANESWTRSQSYYFGSVNGNPSHRVELLDGTPIDQADELDANAIGKPVKASAKSNGANGGVHNPAAITDKRVNGKIESLLANIRAAADGTKHYTLWDNALAIGGYLHLTHWTKAEAVEACVRALPATVKDWDLARRTATEAIEAGMAKPLSLEDRPEYATRRRPEPPPAEPYELGPPPIEEQERHLSSAADSEAPIEQADDNDGPGAEWLNAHPPTEQADLVTAGTLITELEAVARFVAIASPDLRFNHSLGNWLIWSEHFWRPDDHRLAFFWALRLARELAATVRAKDPTKARLQIEKVRFAAAIETGARVMPPLSTAHADWDADHMLLGTPGGVVDLRTGIRRDGQLDDRITKTTSVTPAETPDCPTWIRFLNYAMNDDPLRINFIQRYFGYCLTGLTDEEAFVFLFGPGGAGKGTMVETIASIMGDYAGTMPMEILAGKSWSPTEYYRADMAGKRLIIANEPERGSLWSESFVKEVTGGDTLSGRHPAGRVFRFKPTHKFAIQGNHMPRLRGQSTGMRRRLNILPVTRKPETPDRQLKRKLLAEGSGILRWLITGCVNWQRDGLNPPKPVSDASKDYFDAQDSLARWIEDRCILDVNAKQRPNDLRTDYNGWAETNGELKMGGAGFAEALGQFEDARLVLDRSHGKRWVTRIRLRTAAELL